MGSGWSVSGSGATRTYSFTPGAVQPGTKNVTATNGAGATASSSFGVFFSDTTPPTTTIQCNAAACQAGYYAAPVSVTLSADDGTGSGVQVTRYTTDGTTPDLTNGSDYTGAISLNATTTIKFRSYDNAGNAEAVQSQTIQVDATAPTGPTLTVTENPASGAQFVSGSTLYYKPGASGTFRVSASTSDPETGIASVAFPSISNVTGGGTLTSAPYQMDYTWGSSTSDSGSHNVTATNGVGSTSSASFTLTPDSTAPSGQSITLTGASAPYYTSASVTFTLGDGSDGGSGLDTSSRTVTRETGTLSNGSCSGFTADPGTYSSPDTSVSNGHCYRYTFTIADNVGNVSSAVTATAKVDTQAPADSITLSNVGPAGSAYKSGATIFYNGTVTGGGSFTLTNAVGDAESGPASSTSAMGSGAGWSHSASTVSTPAGGPYVSNPYSWAQGTSSSPQATITGADAAGNTTQATLTFTNDVTGPSVAAPSVTAGYYTSLSVPVTPNGGTDSGSGVATGSSQIQRDVANLASGACGSFSGSWSDVTLVGGVDTSVTNGHCYEYRERLTDNVGNFGYSAASNIAKVDNNPPANSVTLSNVGPAGAAYKSGATVYYNGNVTGGGSFTLTNALSDAESGPGSSTSGMGGGAGWSHSASTVSTPAGGPYVSNPYSWAQGTSSSPIATITGADAAGNTNSATTLTFTNDVTAPSVSAPTVGAGYYTTTSVPVTANGGTDSGSGVAAGSSQIQRDVANLANGSCGSFSGSWTNVTLVSGADTSVTNGHCYEYREQLTDNVGNTGSSSPSNVAMVDANAPTNSLALSNISPAGSALKSNNRIYYNGDVVGGGSFTLTNTVSDAESAAASSTTSAFGGTYAGTMYLDGGASSIATGSYQILSTAGPGQGAAPTVPSSASAPSGVPAGSYIYEYVVTTNGAATTSPPSSTVATTAANGTVTVSGVPLGADLYRQKVNSGAPNGQWVLVASNVSTSPYVDTSTATSGTALPHSDNRAAGGATGWQAFTPGATLATNASTTPAISGTAPSPGTCSGWIIDGAGGVTIPAGSWSVTARVMSGATGNGAAVLSAAVYVTDASGSIVATVFGPTDSAASILNLGRPGAAISVSATTATATTVGASQHLCVMFWRHQTTAFSATTAGGWDELSAEDPSNTVTHPAPTFDGWSHTPSTVSTPAGGPFVSNTFSWAQGTGSSPTEAVTGADGAGNTSQTTLYFTNDNVAPTSGALTVNGTAASGAGTTSYSSSGSFPINVRTDYTETQSSTQSGLASSVLTRASATFSGDACGSFGSPTTITGNPAQNLSTGCYRFTLTGTDNVGNTVSITTTVKVDTSAPSTPTLTLSNATGNVVISGTSVLFRPSGSGSFDIGASSSDGESGIAGYTFPTAAAMGSGWSVSGSGATRTYSYSAGAATPATQSVTATNNAGGIASSSFSVNADSTAPTTSIQCNSAACSAGYYTSTPVQVTLSANDGSGSGVQKIRYTTDGTDPSPVNGSDYVAAIGINSTTTVKFRAYDNVGNEEAVGSQTILVDTTAPSAPSLTLTENPASGAQHVSGTTLYYRPGGGGTFRVSATSADAESGIGSIAFPAIANVTGGGAVTSSPYQSDYTWGATTSDSGAHNVTATNGAGLTSSSSFTFTPDSTAPTGQTITLTGAGAPYYNAASVGFTLGDGTDFGSGIDTSSRTVTRETAPLSGDSCGTFTADPGTFTSPDTSVTGGHCYRYTFTIADNVGNVSGGASATAKVDTAAPTVSPTAPTEVSGAGNQYYDAGTKTQYFRPAGSGSFTLNATASDSDTAVASVAFPDVSATGGWSGSGGTDTSSPYASPSTYSWSGGAAEPGAKTLTATDKAGNTGTDTITLKADSTAPTGQTITLTGANAPYYTAASVSFSLGDGTDADSGVDTSSRTVTRESATLSGDSCGTFSADAGTFTSPDTSVSNGHCYRYTFTIADNVGNVSSGVSATAKVDAQGPSSTLTDPGSPIHQTVALSATANDAETSVQSVAFQYAPAGTSSWTTIATDTTAPYAASWDTTGVADGTYDLRVVATDVLGNSAPSSTVANRVVENSAPDTTITSSPPDPSNDANPTFSFTSSKPSSTFECRIDGGSWSSCTSPDTISPALGGGSHTFDVRATDQVGNADPSPASYTWTIDFSLPDTTIDSSPANPDNNATPTFTFSSNQSPVTFQCRLDGGSWTACTSPDTLSPALAAGSHTFDVRARNQVGNIDPSPASYTWTIDLTAPTVTITAPTTYVNASDPVSYTVTASTPDSDVARVDFYECSDASSACSTGTWNVFGTDATAPYSAVWATPAFDGTKAIRAVAVDQAGNSAQNVRTITIDRTPPQNVTITYPNGYVSGSFTITTDNGTSSDVDASTGVLERATSTLANDTCSSFGSFAAASSPDTLPSGNCAEYRYRVADNAGNYAIATSSNVVKSDAAAPTSAISDPGTNVRGTITLSATASDSGGSGLAAVAFQRKLSSGSGWTTIATDATSPYSISFDTTSVADGVYDFRTVATDVAGNAETAPAAVTNKRIDNTPPSATMLSPGDPVRGTVTLTSTTSDAGSGIATVTYELAPHGGAFATQPASWDTTVVADGLYDLRVIATDNAGSSTTSPLITTRVDNTPPSLTFSSPAAGANVRGTVSLVATASDASPASPPVTFEYKLHSGSTWTATSSSWDTATLPSGDGLYDLRATATDDAGNTAQVVNQNILVDNVPPTVSITAPPTSVNGSFTSPTSFSASAADAGSGVASVQFFECSNTSTDCASGSFNSLGTVAAPGPYTVNWPIPGDGNHALKVVATDNASHTSSAIRNVNVDTTPPDTTITAKPADPSGGNVSFSFTSTETGSTFECQADGGAWSACSSPTFVNGLTDGLHTVQIRAIDPAGNTDPSPASWTWHRDSTPPTGTLNDPGRNIRGTVTLSSAESDALTNGYASGIASVAYQYSADGATWATIGTLTSTPFDSISWDTTAVADGVYRARIVVTDVAGNVTNSTEIGNVRIDNTPPTTSQDDPGQYLRGTKTLTGSAADTGSGIDHVDFQRSPAGANSWTTVGTATSAPYSTSFDTTAVADGHYDFRTVAYDVAGNQANSGIVASRLVDNTPPTATMNDPSTAGGYVRRTITLTSSTSDPNGSDGSGIASVSYQYSTDGGSTWNSTGTSLNTTTLPEGSLKLRVIATDNAGNVTTSPAVDDTIDNTKPVTTDDAPSGYQSADVTVHLNATDAGSGVNITEYSVDGGPYVVGTTVTIPAPADGSNDGAHTIAYFSADNVGNIEQVKSTQVLIDATPPTCPSCGAADYLSGTVTLSASPTPGPSGVKSVQFQYSPHGAATWTSIGTDTTGPAPYTVSWDTTAVPDGHYDLRTIVTDNSSLTSTTDLADKVVDNTPPNVAIVGSPTEGAVVSGNVVIDASAADVTSPIASVQFYVGGALLNTATTPPYSFTWDSTTGTDGSAQIYVVVTDMAGNSTTSATRTVTVDNHSPSPTFADPGSILSGTVVLSATSDPDTAQVDFQRAVAGSGSWVTIATDTGAPFATSLDTTTLPDGLYDFRVVATDGQGNVGTSAVRSNIRVDNTAPTGSITAPVVGATVGGNVTLAVSAADTGSGVGSVRYELRPTGGGAFTTIATSTTSPFAATWNTAGLASGDYDLRPVITDGAGNTFTGATVTVTVDTSTPNVVLADPGSSLTGTVTLTATATSTGSPIANVAFSVSPAGANTWQTIGTDTSSPYNVSFNTATLADGLYDFRAVATNAVGNSASSVRANIHVGNAPPQLESSTPADGSRVGSASAIELVTSEPVTPSSVTLDGTATVTPVISGTRITYNTGPLATGLHSLAGTLTDATGKSAPFRVSFTIWDGSGTPPPSQKNTNSAVSTTLDSAEGFAAVTVPAGAYAPQANDWIVLRITPRAAGMGSNGFVPATEIVDVTAFWSVSGVAVHHFDKPIEILLHSTAKQIVPATDDGFGWRVLRKIPSPPALPDSWTDGFYADATGYHILTRHVTPFTLLKDVQAPAPPSQVRGFLANGHLSLSWTPGADNSGTYDFVSVLADGSSLGEFGPDKTSADVGAYDPQSSITLRETDLAGNTSAPTAPLRSVPTLAGRPLPDVIAALTAAGFSVGTIVEGTTGTPGTVIGPDNLVLAQPGSSIDLTVAPGTNATKFLFRVVSAKTFKPTPRRRTFAARVVVTRAARITAVLFSPRGIRLSTWRFAAKAGKSIVKLRIPAQVRRPGLYAIRWTAHSGTDVVTRTIRIRFVASAKGLPTASPASGPIEVVLAGSKLPLDLSIDTGSRKPKVVSADDVDSAFDLAGSGAVDVQVMVVDVDQFGVGFVRDLHAVFPGMKSVALSRDPKLLAAALKAGATVALPASTPSPTLAAVIAKLLHQR
jgi:hypothetical protein